jgi:hypothetical protein
MRVTLRQTAMAMADSGDLLERLKHFGPKSLRTMLVNWGGPRHLQVPTDAERAALKAELGLGRPKW